MLRSTGEHSAAGLRRLLGSLADILRTDRIGLRPLVPEPPPTIALRGYLNRVFPRTAGLFADLGSSISPACLDGAADSRRADPWAEDLDPRTRGHDHPHAVHILAYTRTHVIRHCWQKATHRSCLLFTQALIGVDLLFA
jgi:hypothetical protein